MGDTLKAFLQDDATRENDYQRDLHESHSRTNPVFNWRKQSTTAYMPQPQKRVWVYIASYIHKFHYPPTVREIRQHIGYASTSSVQNILDRLQKKGIIVRKVRRKARAYTLFVWPPIESFIKIEDG